MTTLWDTTGTQVVKALAAERRSGGSVMSGLALTLVVVVDERMVAEAEAAATVAAAQHPCRLLIVIRRRLDDPIPRLDAEVAVGGRLGPGEAAVMRMYGRLALHAESVTLPLLAPDAPVLVWWHGEPPERIAHDPLGVFSDRRVTDTAQADDPLEALRQRADDFVPGDTDLAWTRTTPWRALIASAFDSVNVNATPPVSASVGGEAGNPSAALLAGWLSARLGLPVPVETTRGPGITSVAVDFASGSDEGTEATALRLDRPDGRSVTLRLSGQGDRSLPLPRPELGDLLAEELRRLDGDPVYAEALAKATGVRQLADRAGTRVHIWRDPALAEAEEAGSPA